MSEPQNQGAEQALDLNNELRTRREKLAALRETGIAFPNDFRRDSTADQLHASYDEKRERRAGSTGSGSDGCRSYDDPPYHG
ncbi:hypothetical protein OS11_05410 [Dickeya oryzae]